MKKNLMALVAVLCYMMTATVFTACSKDDDSNSDGSQKGVVTLYYEFSVGQAYMDYYDIYSIYTDEKGVVQNEKCKYLNNIYSKSVEYNKAPNSYEFSVIGIPKNPLPDIDPDGVYDVSHTYKVHVSVRPSFDSENEIKVIINESRLSSNSQLTKGSKLKEMLSEGQREIVKKVTGTK